MPSRSSCSLPRCGVKYILLRPTFVGLSSIGVADEQRTSEPFIADAPIVLVWWISSCMAGGLLTALLVFPQRDEKDNETAIKFVRTGNSPFLLQSLTPLLWLFQENYQKPG
jgi:hypothetical protein